MGERIEFAQFDPGHTVTVEIAGDGAAQTEFFAKPCQHASLQGVLVGRNHFNRLPARLGKITDQSFEFGAGKFVMQRMRQYRHAAGLTYPLGGFFQRGPFGGNKKHILCLRWPLRPPEFLGTIWCHLTHPVWKLALLFVCFND